MTTVSKPCLVLDTNVIVRAVLFAKPAPRQALTQALNHATVVFSELTWDELSLVLQRPRFDRYISLENRLRVLADLASKILLVKAHSVVSACRDPKDNKFLALALDSQASTLVTGDQDLLVLDPFQTIRICTPAQFLQS